MNDFYFYDGKKFSHEELEKLFKKSRELDENNPDPRAVQVLKMIEGKKVLDVGCAGGGLTRKIAERECEVLAIDVLEDSIKIAKEFSNKQNIIYEVRDLLKQPFPDESFDCITFLETIEHVENPAVYLKEFHRILKVGGYLILSTPNATSLKNIFYALSYRTRKKRIELMKDIATEQKSTGTQLEHVYNWDFPTLVRLLDRSGFDLVDHAFARAGPILIPFFGKKISIIKSDSKILNSLEPFMTTHIMKGQKRGD